MAGGGVRGMEDGIDRAVMTQVGNITGKHQVFIVRSPMDGGMITGMDIGEVNNGTSSQLHTKKSSEIGDPGKQIGIGKRISLGAFRICTVRKKKGTILKEATKIIQRTNDSSYTNLP